MPDYNPFAPTVDIGGTATAQAGPAAVSTGGNLSLGSIAGKAASPNDNHYAAAILLASLIVLWALYESKFRFSMTVG